MGWGLGKKYALKQKTKKKQCRTIAVNDSELCTFSARTFYTTEISDINEKRIANRKYRNIYIIVFNRVIPITEERELDRLYPDVWDTKISDTPRPTCRALHVNADPVLS